MPTGFQYRLRVNSDPISVEGYRRTARRALPAMIWSYVEGGADDGVTLEDNASAFRQWRLRQRSLTGHAVPDLRTSMTGAALELPIALAPCGLSALTHWSGDVAIARAAEAAGTRLCASTASSYSLEEIAAGTKEAHWFQLYPFGNKEFVTALMNRARGAGYTSLFVTVDVPVRGNREGETLHGMTIPPTLTPAAAVDAAVHPRWWWNLLKHRRLAAANYMRGASRSTAAAVQSVTDQDRHMQTDLNWNDLSWMRDQWKGPFYVKGILDPDDAVRAVDVIGANGVVVSNHGGRQLDSALGTLDALPAIVGRIGDRAEVFLDGGVRRGSDVVKALCLGARGVFIGRPYLYGLAAAGEAGVTNILKILKDELSRTLTLMGCPSVDALDRSWIIAARKTNHDAQG